MRSSFPKYMYSYPWWRSYSPEKLNMEYGNVFFRYVFLRRSDAYEEHGDVFFWYALYVTGSARPRKSGWIATRAWQYYSRSIHPYFRGTYQAYIRPARPETGTGSGGATLRITFIVYNEYSIFSVILSPCKPGLGQGHTKKRHLHVPCIVSFVYNPEAKRRGHLLNCKLEFRKRTLVPLPDNLWIEGLAIHHLKEVAEFAS